MATKFKKLFSYFLIVSGFAGVIFMPQVAAKSAENALKMCFTVLIPTLFPFFVFSSIIVKTDFVDFLARHTEKFMRRIFRISGGCSPAVILGFISGFPLGAKTAVDLYDNGCINKSDAEKLLGFCNNAGASFVLGTVGAGIWHSTGTGVVLWLSQILSAVISGVIIGRVWQSDGSEYVLYPEKGGSIGAKSGLVRSVTESASAMINISAFVVFFAVIVSLLVNSGIIPATANFLCSVLNIESKQSVQNILSGIFEMTTGVKLLGNSSPMLRNLAITGSIIGWAGISVHFQVLSFVSDSGLSTVPYWLGKAMQTVLSGLITFIISYLVL